MVDEARPGKTNGEKSRMGRDAKQRPPASCPRRVRSADHQYREAPTRSKPAEESHSRNKEQEQEEHGQVVRKVIAYTSKTL